MKKFRDVLKKKKCATEEVAANAVSGGKIAGTVEAGDDPVIKKRKKAIVTLYRSVMKLKHG